MGRDDTPDALIIGAGPAGLMAAAALAQAGHVPLVAEAKPSVARKFLMAGKSGLNLTKDAPGPVFNAAFRAPWLEPALDAFGPDAVQAWAVSLGQPVFTGSSGRVFPVAMKGSPLLRAWLARLTGQGVQIATRWRWQGFDAGAFRFTTPDGPRLLRPRVTILALGGASWPRLGSDAEWVPWLEAAGVEVAPFRPANMGFLVDWSTHMAPFYGQPVKGVGLHAGAEQGRGEFVISTRGVEGGGIYALSRAIRDGARLTIDLMPDLPPAEVAQRLARPRGRMTLASHLRRVLGLDPVKLALMQEWARPLPPDPQALAMVVKALPARLGDPRPIAEAISSAGGITRASLTNELELSTLPGVFACGEMLDWEAPTGGYLLTGSFATGLWAGRAAAARLNARA